MAVTDAFTNQYKLDLLTNIVGHSFKCALYTQASATLDKATGIYTNIGEITGIGYTAGGMALSGATVALSGDTAYLDFSDPVWTAASITADAAMIYDTSNANHAVAVFSFAPAASTTGTWTLELPAPGATATVRIA